MISPSAVVFGTSVAAMVTGWQDVEGDPENYTFEWRVNGVPVVAADGTLPDIHVRKGNALQVTATPFDGTDAGEPVVSPIVVVGNTPPTLASVAYDKVSYVSGETISAVPMGDADVDGDGVTFLHRWTVDGATVPVTGATLAGNYVTKGTTIVSHVTPYDGTDAGWEVTGATMTVGNAVPVANAQSLSADEDTALVAALSTNDADDEGPFTYQVVTAPTKGAVSIVDGSFTYQPNANANGSDSFTYRLSDGSAWSAPALVSITVQAVNDPPVVQSITPSATYMSPGTQFTMSATATDVDGDLLSYTWTLDGIPVSTASSFAVTAPAAHESRTYVLQIGDGNVTVQQSKVIHSANFYISGLTLTPGADDLWNLNLQLINVSGTTITGTTWTIGGTAVTSSSTTTAEWTNPGSAGIYLVKATAYDNNGDWAVYEMAAAFTTTVQWARIGNDRHGTGVQFLAETLGTEPFEAPHTPTGVTSWSQYLGLNLRYLSFSTDGTMIFAGGWNANGANPHQVYGVRVTDHSVVWKVFAGSHAGRKPAVDSAGNVYVGSSFDPDIFSFRGADGVQNWSKSGYGHVGHLALGSNGRIVAASHSGLATSLDTAGTQLWRTTGVCTASYTGPAIGADGTAYVTCADGTLNAVSASGTKLWSYTAGNSISGSPTVGSDDTIYFGANDSKLYAVTPTGYTKWAVTLGGNGVQPPVLGADGTIYYTVNGFVYALDPDNGAVKWWLYLSSVLQPVLGADGTLYVASQKTVRAISTSGVVKWTWTHTSSIYDVIVAPDGTLYACSDDGYVFAIR